LRHLCVRICRRAGDIRRGRSLVIRTIREGQPTAVDVFLKGMSPLPL
jgi:hypothetical protein